MTIIDNETHENAEQRLAFVKQDIKFYDGKNKSYYKWLLKEKQRLEKIINFAKGNIS